MKYSVVIVAAGSSTRFNQGISKMLYSFENGERVIDRTLKLFIEDEDCTQVVVVCNEEVAEYLAGKKSIGKVMYCHGGATRQMSVYNGLLAVMEDIVLVHDGARCFLEKKDLEKLKKAVKPDCGALLVKSMVDTVKVVEDGMVVKTLNRDTLKRAQTPQGFPTEELLRVYRKAFEDCFTATDDAQLIENYSDLKVRCVESEGHNTKVTVIDDVRGVR